MNDSGKLELFFSFQEFILLLSISKYAYIMSKMNRKNPDLNIDKIVSKYRPLVSFRVKKSISSYSPDWEDIVNEIMVNVVEKLLKGEFRGDSSIGTFIFTITSRRIIDYIREKSKVLKHVPEPDPFPSPFDYFETKEKA